MAKTHAQFSDELKYINPNIKIIGTYTKATEPIWVECLECGNKWNPKAYSLLQGRGCPKCRTKHGVMNNNGLTRKKTTEEYKRQLSRVNKNIEVISDYKSHHDVIKCKCRRCGNIWEARAYSLLQGHGCPKCAKSGTSFMEQFIRIAFEKATNYEVLSRDRKTIGMELDILIPKLKIAIEPGNWFLHKKSLDRDAQKRKKCADKGIRLITIYDKFPADSIKPFDDNCIVFNNDLNKSDHTKLENVIYQLLETSKIKYRFTTKEWEKIEEEAYEKSKAMNNDIFVERMRKIHPNIEILEKYHNSNKKVKVKCKKCGFIWYGTPANMLSGDGCRKCGAKAAHEKTRKTQEIFVQEASRINPSLEIIGKYVSRHKPVKVRCRVCGFVWEANAASILRGSGHKNSKSMHKEKANIIS